MTPAACFGAAAVRLAGQAGLLLGWSPARFWNATPEELAAVLGAATGGATPPDADAIEQLRKAYPDG